MRAESTLLDEWSKKRLTNEIALRVLTWTFIIFIGYLLTSLTKGFSVAGYYKSYAIKQLGMIAPVLLAIFACTIIPMVFKDMKYLGGESWSEKSARGKTGIVIRKVYSEILLWMGGLLYALALITVITLTILLYREGFRDFFNISRVLGYAILYTILSFLYLVCFHHLKRDRPTIFAHISSQPKFIPFIYSLILLFSLFFIYITK